MDFELFFGFYKFKTLNFFRLRYKVMKNREELRKDMSAAQEIQKDLIKKRDLLLSSKKPKENESALKITHEIARLEDFIRMAENKLKMTD